MNTNELLKILLPKRDLGHIRIGEEDRLSIEFANYLRQQSLEKDFPYIWFHVPNQIGSYRAIFGLKAGWMGRIAGVADYCFMGKDQSFFIEFKAAKGKQSPQQKIFETWCKDKDVQYYICRSFEEAKKIINEKSSPQE